MKRIGAWIGLFCCMVLACACGPAPVKDFSMEPLDAKGTTMTSADLKGRVVLIDFWATWCGPCKESMPYISELHEKFGPEGLKVIGLTNELRSTVESFERVNQSKYTICLDTDNSVNFLFKIEMIPTVVILGKRGEILYQGFPNEKETIEATIASALKS